MTQRAWFDEALLRIASGEPLALVTLTDVKGSAPRDAGARMLVWAVGQADTIGGGNLELMIVREARQLLDGPPAPPLASLRRAQGPAGEAPAVHNPFVIERDYPLGPILGQCCGGRVSVRIERLDASHLAWLKAQARAGASAKTPLLLFGAGHVGQAIARAVAPLPFALFWFDTRRDYATEATLIADPRAIAEAAPAGAFYLILTHNHDLDYEITRTALARGDAGYCGLIGSASKRARFERQLRADAISERQIESLVCPIAGALEINDKTPAVIAAAAVAELLQVREALAPGEFSLRDALHVE